MCSVRQCSWDIWCYSEKDTNSRQGPLFSKVSGLILNPVATDKLGEAAGGEEGMLSHGFILFKN